MHVTAYVMSSTSDIRDMAGVCNLTAMPPQETEVMQTETMPVVDSRLESVAEPVLSGGPTAGAVEETLTEVGHKNNDESVFFTGMGTSSESVATDLTSLMVVWEETVIATAESAASISVSAVGSTDKPIVMTG